MDVKSILKHAVDQKASDIFMIPGLPLSYKVNGRISGVTAEPIPLQVINDLIAQIYVLANGRDLRHVTEKGDDDFSFSMPGVSRYRVSSFKQRGSLAAVIRIVTFDLPDFRELNIPQLVIDVAEKPKGLVLVTGPAGSGKSTTLACVIDQINRMKSAHIITLEDPIEYLHKHHKSIVTQREIGVDSDSYITALRAALRQAPDVILVGEMRDFDTIKTAITAAETGHLVISTLHTIGASNTIDRIIDSFAPEQQQQIRIQVSMMLVAIFSQQLVPTISGKEMPAFEMVYLNDAMRNMVRESKTHQIDALIHSSGDPSMVSMDDSLFSLFQSGKITRDTLLSYCTAPDQMERRVGRAGTR